MLKVLIKKGVLSLQWLDNCNCIIIKTRIFIFFLLLNILTFPNPFIPANLCKCVCVCMRACMCVCVCVGVCLCVSE